MKRYKKEDLIKNAPFEATHLNYGEYSYNYIFHDQYGFRIWLGIKHGGWSEKMMYKHPKYSSLIEISR